MTLRKEGARAVAAWVMTATLASSSPVSSQVPPEQQGSFLVRALQYDRNLEARSGSALHVLVVFASEDGPPEGLVEAFNRASLDAGSVTASSEIFASTSELLARLDVGDVGALYIDDSARRALTSILQVTRSRKVPSMAGSRDMVERGVSLGVFLESGTTKLVVNRRSALVEGLDLSSNLLRIATIVE